MKKFYMRVCGQAERVEMAYTVAFDMPIGGEVFKFVVHRGATGSDWTVSGFACGSRIASLPARFRTHGHLTAAGTVAVRELIKKVGEPRMRSVLSQ